jgi:hypothetical protein
VGVTAVCLAVFGLALLFAGAEVTAAVFRTPVAEPFPSILGAALLGFASLNWIARHHILGGIHGRAVVVANQTHLTIGAIMLVKHGLAHHASIGLWALSAFYVVGAALFTALMLGRGLPSVR